MQLDKGFYLDVVLGPEFRHLQDIEKLKKNSNKIQIHKTPSNIAELMYKADLVITSPGLSMFESIYVGTPFISIYQNAIQEYYYKSFNYPYMLNEPDIKSLSLILNEISPLNKRKELTQDLHYLDVGAGKSAIIKKVSQLFGKIILEDHVQNIKKEYEVHLKKHDINSPEAVYYKDMKKGNLRFKILSEIANLDNKRILDFGCGNALLMDFLKI